jgi:hypothetical protein
MSTNLVRLAHSTRGGFGFAPKLRHRPFNRITAPVVDKAGSPLEPDSDTGAFMTTLTQINARPLRHTAQGPDRPTAGPARIANDGKGL